MVCPLGRGKMAAMVRLLGNGNYPEITAEEAGHEKLAAQTIHWEFHEADEANLLEEEDMHVFDSRPLADPLDLVCCNACKKPVKASQYAAHAERCKLIKSAEDLTAELDGGSSHKKPQRKGRKKFQASHNNQVSMVGEQEKSESLDGDEETISESNVHDQTGMVSSFSSDAKGRAQKRLIVGKSAVMGHRRDEQIMTHSEFRRHHPLGGQSHDVPAPLATKMYHFQGSRRFRSTLGQLYVEAVGRDEGCEVSRKSVEDPRLLPSEAVLSSKFFLETPKDSPFQPKMRPTRTS